jgi:hypothetical protein
MNKQLLVFTGTTIRETMLLGVLLDPNHETSFEFKKSYIYRPLRKEAFGDKDVSHRKMYGSVKPGNLQGCPYAWSDSWTLPYGQKQYDYQYTFGSQTGRATCWEHGKDGWGRNFSDYYVRGLQLRQEGDRLYAYLGNGMSSSSDSTVVPPEPELSWGKQNTYYDLSTHRWYLNGRYWSVYNVSFEVLNPLPYYWLDYMESIRPEYMNGDHAGTLSEVIRNTISENTTYNTNNYANLFQVVDLINDFKNGKVSELFETASSCIDVVKETLRNNKSSHSAMRSLFHKKNAEAAASAWLKYRYAYNTTKSDVEQYARAKFGEYLNSLTKDRVLRGSGEVDHGQVRIKMRLHDDTSPNLTYFLIGLDQYGLFPGLYNFWDMVPFSFVTDWFTHTGDIFQDYDQRIYFQYYQVDELLVSYKQRLVREEPWGVTTYEWYDRYLYDEFPAWEFYDDTEVSGKTVIKRLTDAGSLAVGLFK